MLLAIYDYLNTLLKLKQMKKIFTLLVLFVIMSQAVGAAFLMPERLKASEIMLPLGNTGKKISMLDLSNISVKDFEKISGRDMKWADKMMFKSAQKELRRSINKDGTLNNKKIEKFYKKYNGDVTAGFNIGGFALGLLLSIIGVLIAYLIDSSDNANLRKWAWIGFGVSVAIWLLFAIL